MAQMGLDPQMAAQLMAQQQQMGGGGYPQYMGGMPPQHMGQMLPRCAAATRHSHSPDSPPLTSAPPPLQATRRR